MKESNIIFQDDGKWLHPLFKLEEFLIQNDFDASELFLKDKIIGLAAAFLITRMGFRRCHGVLMSKKALEFFITKNIEASYDKLVEAIQCRTETLLNTEMSLDKAHSILSQRAGR